MWGILKMYVTRLGMTRVLSKKVTKGKGAVTMWDITQTAHTIVNRKFEEKTTVLSFAKSKSIHWQPNKDVKNEPFKSAQRFGQF